MHEAASSELYHKKNDPDKEQGEYDHYYNENKYYLLVIHRTPVAKKR